MDSDLIFYLIGLLVILGAGAYFIKQKNKKKSSRRGRVGTGRKSEEAKPVPEPPKSMPEVPKPASELERPVPEPPKPVPKPPQIVVETPKPISEPIKPVPKLTKPVPEPSKPVIEPPKPTPELSKPVTEPAKPVASEPVQPKAPKTVPLALNFNIAEPADPIITDDMEINKAVLKAVADVSEMRKYLQSSNHKDAEIFNKKLQQFEKDINRKLINKIDKFDYDDDEISNALSGQLLKVVSSSLLPLARSIYLSEPSDIEFYSGLLKLYNAHLSKCGIYTYNVEPGRKYTNEERELMEFIFIKTTDKSLDGIIKEVERLPYMMKYFDEDGNVQDSYVEGSMMVWKYEG